jgi:hypothetical protein
LKNLKPKEKLNIKTYHPWIISSSCKLITMLISHFSSCFVGFIFPIHAIPYHFHLLCMYASNAVNEGLQIFIFLYASGGMIPMPQNWMHKTYKILSWLEVNHTRVGFDTSNFLFASDWKWSHSTWVFT